MPSFFETIRKEWQTVRAAPISFVIVCVAIIGGCYSVFHFVYKGKLDDAHDLIEHWKGTAEFWKEQASHPLTVPYTPAPPVSQKRVPESETHKMKAMPLPNSPPQTVNAPNGIGSIGGTLINPQVNNYERPYRHLTDQQKTALTSLVAALPTDSNFLHVFRVNDPESLIYGNEIADLFKSKTKAIDTYVFFKDSAKFPEGVQVIVDEKDSLFPTAQVIANTFQSAGIPVKFFSYTDPHPGEIDLVIGTRAER